MRDYQRIKQSKYILPRTVYHQTIWRIRDYYRLKELADDEIQKSIEVSEPTSNTNVTSDTVFNTVARREKFIDEITKIDLCLNLIPDEYQKGVWNNIQFNSPYPIDADRSTYGRYKSKFVYKVAEKLEII